MATNAKVLHKDMTREEFKTLVREVLQEILWEMEQEMPDPDEGLELQPELAEYLRAAIKSNQWEGESLDKVARDLGLDEQ